MIGGRLRYGTDRLTESLVERRPRELRRTDVRKDRHSLCRVVYSDWLKSAGPKVDTRGVDGWGC